MTEQARKKAVRGVLIAAALVLVFGGYVLMREHRGDILTVAFLDVGQGDAIYIEAPNGAQVLVDGGPSRQMLSALSAVMPFYDRSIDAIVVTNPDKDHIAGFIELLRRYSVTHEFEPGTVSATAVYAQMSRAVLDEGITPVLPGTGDIFLLDKGRSISLEILYPDADVRDAKTNDGSIIAKLSYGDICFILSGDAPMKAERRVIELFADGLDCEVLKTGHHGSKTSTSAEYVEAITPDYAVISAGADNRYGHPHEQTLETLRLGDVAVLRTDIDGTVVFKTDGKTLSYTTKK